LPLFRDRKRNFTEPEINVIQDEVEKKFSLLNDKFSTSKANQKKLEVWTNISRMVSALGVAQRTPKECKIMGNNILSNLSLKFNATVN
jgi:hypothetical protein